MDEALMKRVLPHSIEAEQSVIGSMLMDKEAIIAASEIVTARDFYQQQYGIMFEMCIRDRIWIIRPRVCSPRTLF